MKYQMFLKLLLSALLAVLLCGGAAVAEGELLEAHVELYAEGSFVEETPILYMTFGLQSFDSYMIEQLNAQADTIKIDQYGMSADMLYGQYQRLLNAYPELFFVNGGYSYYSEVNGVVPAMIPKYNYTGDELTQMQSVYNSGVSAIVNYARKADDDVARMLRANDYICANYGYDTSVYEDIYTAIYSPEQMFLHGEGVCQAYMLVYRAVLNELGIGNITVSSDEMNHTWNMVYLDGSWYHIDVTWNDPLSPSSYGSTDVPLRVNHTNFLLSDTGITAAGHSGWDDGWEIVVSADNTQYDSYWWRNVRQAIPMTGDVAYYVYSDYSNSYRDVMSYNFATGSSRVVHTFDYGSNGYYKSYFPPVWVNRGTIYYAILGDLYGIQPGNSEAELVYSTGDSSLWIWHPFTSSAGLVDTELKVSLGGNPQKPGTVTSIKLGYVVSEDTMRLPADTVSIAEEAFAGATIRCVGLPEGVTTIGARAFADNKALEQVNLPDSLTDIAEDAFAGCPNLVLIGAEDSVGEAFAEAQGIPFVIQP